MAQPKQQSLLDALIAANEKRTQGEWTCESCNNENCWCMIVGIKGEKDRWVAASGCIATNDAHFIAFMANNAERIIAALEERDYYKRLYERTERELCDVNAELRELELVLGGQE